MSTFESLIDLIPSSDECTKETPPLKVSELVAMLKSDIEQQHRHVRVVGEVASFKQWHSGHCYFDIKDEHALIPAVMFKPHVARLPFKVSDGQQILFSGRVSVYAANAKLQMIVENMEPLGQGALALAFLQLKERLAKEGLFDERHKKPLKILNRRIGIVTSSHGAAIRDMLKIIKSRMPGAHVILACVRVQGQGSEREIASAIKLLDQSGDCDVIIVGRGGGSLLDLWSFNEEIVARAIFAAKTPIISAVGHETDTTVSDFVADIRAATPTHAAMLAAASLTDLLTELNQASLRLLAEHNAALNRAKLSLSSQKKLLGDPRILLFRHWQQLDEFFKILEDSIKRQLKLNNNNLQIGKLKLDSLAPFYKLRIKKETLFALKTRLYKLDPSLRHKILTLELARLREKFYELGRTRLSAEREAFAKAIAKLHALSPLSVLKRGFSVVCDEKGRIISDKAQLKLNDKVAIRLHDGTVKALISSME